MISQLDHVHVHVIAQLPRRVAFSTYASACCELTDNSRWRDSIKMQIVCLFSAFIVYTVLFDVSQGMCVNDIT